MIDLSIIIPTYNRPRYLSRILNYYSNSDINCRFIVADSSIKENKFQNQKIVKSHKNMNVLYLKDFESDITPMEKIFRSIQMVNETYCVFCADDDFITPNSIKKCVDFLEKNPDYSCAHGNYVQFKLNDKKSAFFWKKIYLPQKTISLPDSKQRLVAHMSNYIQTFYSVHRTDIQKKNLEAGNKYTNDFYFGELLPSMITLIYGKMKKIDILYGIREVVPREDSRSYEDIPCFIKDASYQEKYDKYITCLAKHLSEKEGIDYEEAIQFIDSIWQIYLNNIVFKNNNLSDKINKIFTDLKMPKWADGIFRQTYNRLILQPQGKPSWKKNIPNTEYYKDLKVIKEYVLPCKNND